VGITCPAAARSLAQILGAMPAQGDDDVARVRARHRAERLLRSLDTVFTPPSRHNDNRKDVDALLERGLVEFHQVVVHRAQHGPALRTATEVRWRAKNRAAAIFPA